MKKILLFTFAIVIANLAMAQFEKDYSRAASFEEAVFVPSFATPESFDRSQLLLESLSRTRNEFKHRVTFDEEGEISWGYFMSHTDNLANMDWKIDSEVDNPFDWTFNGSPKSPLLHFMGNETVADFSVSKGKFAFINAISLVVNPALTGTQARLQSHLTIGPFDFSEIENPVVKWTQLYKKFNSDQTFVSYSTDNTNYTKVRVNNITTGWGQVHNNSVFLPSSLSGQEQVYLRFTLEELTSTSPEYGAGYGWEIDDIEIIENSQFELEIGRIETEFFYRHETIRNIMSTYMRLPKEVLDSKAEVFFAAPFLNKGSVSVNPELEVTVTNPNGDVVFNDTHVKTGAATLTGEYDTLYFPLEKNLSFNPALPNPIELIPGEYKINYKISIPGETEQNMEDNEANSFFVVTEDGMYTRDFDKTNNQLGPSNWGSGGYNGDMVGTKYMLYKTTGLKSVDVFISEESFPDNAFSIVIARGIENGTEELKESQEITLTASNIGTWVNVPINTKVEIEPGEIEVIFVMAKMQYNNSDDAKKHIFIGADNSTKASVFGTTWYLPHGPQQNYYTITNAPRFGMCLRLNTGDISIPDVIENMAKEAKVKLYPNPANDFVNVEVSEEIKTVEILSVMGNTISTFNVNDNVFACPTQDLSNGNYLMRIHTNNTVVVEPFSVLK